jgi:hypothetical protein
MPTQTTIKRTITIKKYTITRSVISANCSTLSKDLALAEAAIEAARANAQEAAI